MASQDAVLKAASNCHDFRVYHIDESGKPDYQYAANSMMMNCVTDAINLARQILSREHLQKAFRALANRCLQTQPELCIIREEGVGRAVDEFIIQVCTTTEFPVVFVDDTLRNPSLRGYASRRPYDGIFNFSDQYIGLNGSVSGKRARSHGYGCLSKLTMFQRFQEMLEHIKTVHFSRSSRDEKKRADQEYRNFVWMFGNTLLHEIAHLFYTYVTSGVTDTPPDVDAHVPGIVHERGSGESGRCLELLVHGGVLRWYRNPYFLTPLFGTPEHSVSLNIVALLLAGTFEAQADVYSSAALLAWKLQQVVIRSTRITSMLLFYITVSHVPNSFPLHFALLITLLYQVSSSHVRITLTASMSTRPW